MGTAAIIVQVDTSLETVVLRAFVGGVVVLCVILAATKLLRISSEARRIALFLVLGVIMVVSSLLLGSAWVSITDNDNARMELYQP